jgi:hypothetical protein
LDYLGLNKVHIFGASLGKNIFACVHENVYNRHKTEHTKPVALSHF